MPQFLAVYKRVNGDAPFHETDDMLRQIALEAVVLTSPDAAVPLIADLPHNAKSYGARFDAISNLLVRLNTSATRLLIEQLFASPDENDRLAILSGLMGVEDDLRDKQ